MNSNTRSSWLRVNSRRRCPICGHIAWCLVAVDGSAAICPRVESGKRAGAAGYLHRLLGDGWRSAQSRLVRVERRTDVGKHIDFDALAERYAEAVDPDRLRFSARSLGVSVESLTRLHVGHDGLAWTFSMRDAGLHVVGIRRRLPSGRKLSVRGGHEGLFIPTGLSGVDPILVAEGPTDTAALLGLGFNVVGRPSCTGGIRHLSRFLRRRSVVIVADADEPGRRGAQTLASTLRPCCRSVRIIEPPNDVKDARQWVRAGATRDDIFAAIGRVERPARLHGRAIA